MVSSDPSNFPDKPLIQEILEPLLDDFQYWFSEARNLLTSPRAEGLAADQRQTLLNQLETAQQEVATMRTLLLATAGKAGVDPKMVGNWHQLVSRCWQVARELRQSNG